MVDATASRFRDDSPPSVHRTTQLHGDISHVCEPTPRDSCRGASQTPRDRQERTGPRRLVITAAATLWFISVAISFVFEELWPGVLATAAVLLLGSLWLPFGAIRWAQRELQPPVRWLWLGINATIIVFAAPIISRELLIGSLLVIDASAWLAFALGLRVVLWRDRLAEPVTEANSA